jgi:UDP-N-acetylmuramate dehydrogenase
MAEILKGVSLRPYTTLRVGGPAERFLVANHVDELAFAATVSQGTGMKTTVLGWGSNVLPSDRGVPGLVVINQTRRLIVLRTGEVTADTGCGFQELFLKSAQAGLRGLEFAVGIPGTVGGALVSNAGAYRSCVSEFLTGIEIVLDGERKWVGPEWMEFSYRDSVLRRPDAPPVVMLRVRMQLPQGEPKRVYDEARDYQRQRIGKQPPSASAGSFFKNVNSMELAAKIPGLTDGMRRNGVVPAGFLIEQSGLKGYRLGGAMLGARHANFILNVGGATATEIRSLAHHAKKVVSDKFGVELEEEVLYLGDWDELPA